MSKSLDFNDYLSQLQQALKLQGLQPKTVQAYCRTLRRVNERISKPLNKLTVADLKKYFSNLVDEYSWSTVKLDRCALVFFYTHVLEREWQWIKIVKAPCIKTIPVVLTQDEVIHVLSQLEKPRYKAVLTLIYSCGLRISEALHLRTQDICREKMTIHIRNSKGNKDRLVPLPHLTLSVLEWYWRMHGNRNLLFPKFIGLPERIQRAIKPMEKGTVQSAFKAAVFDSGINKHATVHTLRHSYATHLVEAGVHMRVIQQILGHASPNSTAIYAQISKPAQNDSVKRINKMVQRLSNIF